MPCRPPGLDRATRADDYLTVVLCAEGLGGLRRLCTNTAKNARQRRQFWQTIAQHQAVRHRRVDMLVAFEQAVAVCASAVDYLSSDAATRGRATSAAKWIISRACRQVGESTIRIHGATGTTDELPVGYYFERALVISELCENSDERCRRFERLTYDSGEQ